MESAERMDILARERARLSNHARRGYARVFACVCPRAAPRGLCSVRGAAAQHEVINTLSLRAWPRTRLSGLRLAISADGESQHEQGRHSLDTVLGIAVSGRAYAQDVAPGPGVVEVALISGGTCTSRRNR
jgi:hypothetical protein